MTSRENATIISSLPHHACPNRPVVSQTWPGASTGLPHPNRNSQTLPEDWLSTSPKLLGTWRIPSACQQVKMASHESAPPSFPRFSPSRSLPIPPAVGSSTLHARTFKQLHQVFLNQRETYTFRREPVDVLLSSYSLQVNIVSSRPGVVSNAHISQLVEPSRHGCIYVPPMSTETPNQLPACNLYKYTSNQEKKR